MKALFNLFWRICLLRQSPAAVPANGPFVATVVLANLLCSILVSAGFGSEVNLLTTATSIIVSQTTTAGLVWIALSWAEKADRFVTTITAIFGCDLIITAVFSLLLPITGTLGSVVGSALLLMFLVWSVAVAGFILHRALETGFGAGVAVALGISLMSVILGQVAIGA
jgi:hypothetical protein